MVDALAQSTMAKRAQKDNQQLKTAIQRGRGFWDAKERYRAPSQLKLITKRGNCGEAGSWNEGRKSSRRPGGDNANGEEQQFAPDMCSCFRCYRCGRACPRDQE